MTDGRSDLAEQYGAKAVRTLDHILGFADEIDEIVAEGRTAFLATKRSQRAAEAILERIGEAINRLPATFLASHPDQPWARIVGLRNLAIHEYEVVDYMLVWNVMERRVPPLRHYIATLVND